MRKGRSSRRSRISRPLIGVSVKGESISPESGPVGPTSAGGSPRVVVGIPDSDPPPSAETPSSPPLVEMKAPVTMPSFTKTLVESFVPPPEEEHDEDRSASAPALTAGAPRRSRSRSPRQHPRRLAEPACRSIAEAAPEGRSVGSARADRRKPRPRRKRRRGEASTERDLLPASTTSTRPRSMPRRLRPDDSRPKPIRQGARFSRRLASRSCVSAKRPATTCSEGAPPPRRRSTPKLRRRIPTR